MCTILREWDWIVGRGKELEKYLKRVMAEQAGKGNSSLNDSRDEVLTFHGHLMSLPCLIGLQLSYSQLGELGIPGIIRI